MLICFLFHTFLKDPLHLRNFEIRQNRNFVLLYLTYFRFGHIHCPSWKVLCLGILQACFKQQHITRQKEVVCIMQNVLCQHLSHSTYQIIRQIIIMEHQMTKIRYPFFFCYLCHLSLCHSFRFSSVIKLIFIFQAQLEGSIHFNRA